MTEQTPLARIEPSEQPETEPVPAARNEARERRWGASSPMALIRGPVVIGYLVVLLFFAGLGTWAALANIASATVARGVVSPEGSRKTIQHLEGGIITEILVNEGDKVSAGDSLVVLQETQARASFEELQHPAAFGHCFLEAPCSPA